MRHVASGHAVDEAVKVDLRATSEDRVTADLIRLDWHHAVILRYPAFGCNYLKRISSYKLRFGNDVCVCIGTKTAG